MDESEKKELEALHQKLDEHAQRIEKLQREIRELEGELL